jgi:teichuronic acid biosynthesis glycosyltransferase TuaC
MASQLKTDNSISIRQPNDSQPRLLVFSSLFPSDVSPTSGTFIRERMFRVAEHIPIVVVSPQVWSPLDWFVRLFRKSFRPIGKPFETINGIDIFRPKVLSVPAVFKQFDGLFMAWGTAAIVKKLNISFRPTIIDAHFAYPDGFAAAHHAQKLKLPLTITLRGSKDEWLIGTPREALLKKALQSATQLIAVSESLKKDVAQKILGTNANCIVVGNGVDLQKFLRQDKSSARQRLEIHPDAKVLISVGALVDRKGFHRVIPLLKALKQEHPNLLYLIVGGGATHGDMTETLKKLAAEHGVLENVRFCGNQLPENLKWFYSAADVFTLATEHEGWANVFLEAMACGLPVITTLVGGNSQVVAEKHLGLLSKFWDPEAFTQNLRIALQHDWDRDRIVNYAQSNSWDSRVDSLRALFHAIPKI